MWLELANKTPHDGRLRKGPAVLVGHWAINVALKEGEHGEPDACSAAMLVGPSVGQGMIVQEESGGDVEGDEYIDGIVFVSSKDEEDPKKIQDPG